MDRIGSMSGLLANLTFLSYDIGYKNAKVKRNLGRSNEDIPFDQDIESLNEHNKLHDEHIERRGEYGYSEDQLNIGGAVLHAIVEGAGEYVKPGVDALLSQIVVASWSAFESSAIDLWAKSVDTSRTLAENVIKRGLTSRKSDEESSFFEEKTIKLSNLHRYDYDLRDKMGKVFVDERKIRLDSFNLLKSAYKVAFGQPSEDLFKKYPDLHTIEAVRHLVAHRAGIVDRKFKKLVRNHKEFNDLDEGKPIPLNAGYAMNSVDTIIRCFIDLFAFVDEWVGHDQRNR